MPLPLEIENCRPYLAKEIELLRPKVMLALGAIAWNAILDHLSWPRPRPNFAHGKVLDGPTRVVGCYHVSQQNTQTGRLTVTMFDTVLADVAQCLDRP